MNSAKILTAVYAASSLAVFAGFGYIIDCRLNGGKPDACWLTGLPIMGLGGVGAGGFRAGYGTYNPALRRPEDA